MLKKIALLTTLLIAIPFPVFAEVNSVDREVEITQEIYKLININGIFKDYYGGMYITPNHNNIILQIVNTNLSSEDSKEIQNLLTIDNSIRIEYVNNNYNSLEETNKIIVDYFSGNNIEYGNLIGHYIDVFSNKIVVELKDNNIEQQQLFKAIVINSPLIVFVSKKENVDTLQTGGGITTKGVPDNCSMGFRAKIGSMYGYITAGHCYNNVGASSTGGTVAYRHYGGTVDAAFVNRTDYTIILYNTLKYPRWRRNSVKSSRNLSIFGRWNDSRQIRSQYSI